MMKKLMQMRIEDVYHISHLISFVPFVKKCLLTFVIVSFLEICIIFDLNANLGRNLASGMLVFLLIINIIIMVVGLLFLKLLKESLENKGIDFVNSVDLSNQLQKEIVTPVTSSYSKDAKNYSAIKANLMRFESFVVVFNEIILIFIKEPKEVQIRLDLQMLDQIAEDLAEITGLRNSKYEIKAIRTNFGVKHFQVQKLGK